MLGIIEKHIGRLKDSAERLLGASAAVKLTFIYGVFLSCLAIVTSGTLNRDGMLYVEAASAFQRGGVEGAIVVFSWPFFSILMAYVSEFSFLSIEQAGYFLNAIFMGGAGALLVACAQRSFPNAAWAIAVAFLATPGINDYRHEIIREFGCWFFVLLGFWMAIRWRETGRWFLAWGAQFSIVIGALFRPEALAFLIALVCWQLCAPSSQSRWKNLLLIGFLQILGGSILIAAFLMEIFPSHRLISDLSRLSIQRIIDKANVIANHWNDYAQPNALTILVFGSLSLIPIKFANTMGIMLIPMFTPLARGIGFFKPLRQSGIFAWAALANLLVLCVFVTDLQFLAGRYVAQWALFLVPIVGYGLYELWQGYARSRRWIVILAIVLPLSNVINDPGSKMYFREAGEWLKNRSDQYENIYLEDGRTSYYAGLGLFTGKPPEDRDANLARLIAGEYDLIALLQTKNDTYPSEWINDQNFEQLAVFRDKKGNGILILAPRKVLENATHNKSILPK